MFKRVRGSQFVRRGTIRSDSIPCYLTDKLPASVNLKDVGLSPEVDRGRYSPQLLAVEAVEAAPPATGFSDRSMSIASLLYSMLFHRSPKWQGCRVVGEDELWYPLIRWTELRVITSTKPAPGEAIAVHHGEHPYIYLSLTTESSTIATHSRSGVAETKIRDRSASGNMRRCWPRSRRSW